MKDCNTIMEIWEYLDQKVIYQEKPVEIASNQVVPSEGTDAKGRTLLLKVSFLFCRNM